MPLELLHARQAAQRADVETQLAQIGPLPFPVTLEMGCGHGHFLTAYAEAHPATTCLGVDMIRERIARATRKRNRARLGHLHFILSEARTFLECLPPAVRLGDIYLLFPDPWPKTRHHKNRLLGPALLTALSTRTTPASRLFFRTDFEPYFRAAETLLQQRADWKLLPAGMPWPFEQVTVFQERATTGYFSLVAQARPD